MFTTGTPSEGAVNYADPNAVCGTGWVPTLAQNRQNLFLPKDGSCAQPIGPRWVANITKFFAYAFDAAGLTFGAPNTCQDPSLLWRAVVNIARWHSPPCLSELMADGTPPAAGKPKAYFDDTVGEKILYTWDCTASAYVAIGVNDSPCAAEDVGSTIPAGAKMLICDGGTVKRADIPSAAGMREIGRLRIRENGNSGQGWIVLEAVNCVYEDGVSLVASSYGGDQYAIARATVWDSSKAHVTRVSRNLYGSGTINVVPNRWFGPITQISAIDYQGDHLTPAGICPHFPALSSAGLYFISHNGAGTTEQMNEHLFIFYEL